MKPITLYQPLKSSVVAQGFAGNANTYYNTHQLIGHPGLDMVSYWHDSVMAVQDGFIYKVTNKGNKDISEFRGVFQLIEGTDGYTYEICYGHFDTILVDSGQTVLVGDVLGLEGNSGVVYAGGKEVTKEERMAGSRQGTHLHFQVRKCKKVKEITSTEQYLTAQQGGIFRDSEGYAYWIPDYNNGFNGCVIPSLEAQTAGAVAELRKKAGLLQTLVNLYKKLRGIA